MLFGPPTLNHQPQAADPEFQTIEMSSSSRYSGTAPHLSIPSRTMRLLLRPFSARVVEQTHPRAS